MICEECEKLLKAFDRLSAVPSDQRTRRPLTPNDPATIAKLAAEVINLTRERDEARKEMELACTFLTSQLVNPISMSFNEWKAYLKQAAKKEAKP